MRLISINVGQPREIVSDGQTVVTSIFKFPVSGPVRVGRTNLDGDRQSDLRVHGGVEKAVYAYPSEHYAYWRSELPDADLPWGAFGENLTIEGLTEERTHIGERFRIGSSELVVTQPRMPCFKLALRFGRADMIKRFLLSGRSGFYLSVAREGEIDTGNEIESLSIVTAEMTVAEIFALYSSDADDPANQSAYRRASEIEGLPDGWRERFRQRIRTAE